MGKERIMRSIMQHVMMISIILLLVGCASVGELKQEAGYGNTPAPQCEVQKNWQAIATSTDFVKTAQGKASIVTVRILPEWAVQTSMGFTAKDENGNEKSIIMRLVHEVVFFPKNGGYETYHGYPTTDMKYLNVVVPGKLKHDFDEGNWMFPSGSYRSVMTANGPKSEIIPVKLDKDNGCITAFDSTRFFKEHPSKKVYAIRDTASDGDAVKFLLVKLGEQFAQDFSIDDRKYFAASQEDVVRASGLSNQATGLDYALNNQRVPVSPFAFTNPITAGLQAIPVAMFLYKVFDDQHALRGANPEANFTRREASEFMGKVLRENQNEAEFAMQKVRILEQELQKMRELQEKQKLQQ